MNDPTVEELEHLRAEVAELRALVETLTNGHAEIVCRRLAVVDDLGERITLTATTFGEANLVVAASPIDTDSTVDIVAGPIDDNRTEVAVTLWGGGNAQAQMQSFRENDSEQWRSAIDVEDHNVRDWTLRTVLEPAGVTVHSKDLGGFEFPGR